MSREEQIAYLDSLVSKQEVRIQEAYRQYVDNATSDDVIGRLTQALQDGDIDGFMRILQPHINIVATSLIVAYTDAAFDMAKEIAIVLPRLPAPALATSAESLDEALKPRPTVSVGFDPSHPRAVEQMRGMKLDLIRQITETERNNIKDTMLRALDEGWGSRKAAQQIKQTIGLTSSQMEHVRSYRNLLEARSEQALSRKLRDRRFDGTVQSAIDRNRPLSQKQIDMMVDRYYKNYVRYRAEVIARTEATKAISQARMESIEQMMETTGMPRSGIKRKWNYTHDSRVRSFHASMQQGVVGMDEPFVDGKGNKLMFPGDPNAPSETTVQCRCVMTIQPA